MAKLAKVINQSQPAYLGVILPKVYIQAVLKRVDAGPPISTKLEYAFCTAAIVFGG